MVMVATQEDLLVVVVVASTEVATARLMVAVMVIRKEGVKATGAIMEVSQVAQRVEAEQGRAETLALVAGAVAVVTAVMAGAIPVGVAKVPGCLEAGVAEEVEAEVWLVAAMVVKEAEAMAKAATVGLLVAAIWLDI